MNDPFLETVLATPTGEVRGATHDEVHLKVLLRQMNRELSATERRREDAVRAAADMETQRNALREEMTQLRKAAKKLAALVPPIRITREPSEGVRERAEFPDGSICEERMVFNGDLTVTITWDTSPPSPSESMAFDWAQAGRARLERSVATFRSEVSGQ